jgi:glycosyltransferase involved in cell wall biosynthesis
MTEPIVSVLMPTYRQEAFAGRALRSLLDQDLVDWELAVVDDGSPDRTGEIVQRYLADPRVTYVRNARNEGLGAALNRATALATGRYLAYLPSDDVYDPRHLSSLVATLEADPGLHLAYAGVRWGPEEPGRGRVESATLQGDEAVGRERDLLDRPLARPPLSGNLLALVQVAHRRTFEAELRWPERAEVVSDRIEADFWRALLDRGARFAYTGRVTCTWSDHPDQRHKIVGGDRWLPNARLGESGGTGLSAYRRYYGVGAGTWLDWRPAWGFHVDERSRFGRYAVRRDLPSGDGLRILLVGELGFNPERIMALEERGHRLAGLWAPQVDSWDTIGPLGYGNVENIQFGPGWEDAVRRARPDVIYGLLNWQALGAVNRVLDADLGIPLVMHFKEGPEFAQRIGIWGQLRRALLESAAQVFVNEENRAWYRWALDAPFPDETTLILDGDLPKGDAMTDEWTPRLSAADGEVHTVCAGRPYGLSLAPFAPLAAAGIHVHLYGLQFFGLPRFQTEWVQEGLASGYLHLHDAVEPRDWVRELSRYDAAWAHLFTSRNGGDVRRATWDDLNVPARFATYAMAGLPWILRDNTDSLVAADKLARRHDIGLFYGDVDTLREQLDDRALIDRLTHNARATRASFTFDAHVDQLVALFRRVVQTGS